MMAKQFKAVAITGPRQSGKTTLAKMTFPGMPYVSLESPDERSRAISDPRLFLSRFSEGGIIDEVQRAPELFSYLQEDLDAAKQPGRYILTGSQQFGMMQSISQTLSGRLALLTLLPFSCDELYRGDYLGGDIQTAMWMGGYPPIFDQRIEPRFWYDSYISTYIERDVRQIVNVKDTNAFQRFTALCAGNVGQLFNANRIGADCGVNHGTIGNWLSVLETSFIAFRLQPHYKNYRKRIVKTPKLYFWDVGLAVRLLGIETAEQLKTHPLRGSLFENWVVVELLKVRYNQGNRGNLFFWRNNIGLEVDVVADFSGKLVPIEIKSGATLASDWLVGLHKWLDLAGDDAVFPILVYGGERRWRENGVEIFPWADVPSVFAEFDNYKTNNTY